MKIDKNKVIVCQFSGGETSGMLRRFLGEYYKTHKIITLFENTGKEDPKTLDFVHNCDKHFNWNVVWLEAVVYIGIKTDKKKHVYTIEKWEAIKKMARRLGFTQSYLNRLEHSQFPVATKHKVVDYYTASRNGEPFESVIKKYGLPNMVYKHCTRELKIRPKNSYIKSLGLKTGEYVTAIGIRSDENHRVSKNLKSKSDESIFYPFIDIFPVTKAIVKSFWERQPFQLGLSSIEGNCDLCFKKSIKSLVQLTRENPQKIVWWRKMGRQYATTGKSAHINPRFIFRGNLSAQDLLIMSRDDPNKLNKAEYEIKYDCFCNET